MTAEPLFVIGCPRSGTTLLLDLLAGTRAFGYVSTSGARRDVDESLHGRTRIYDIPLIGEPLLTHRARLLGPAARLDAAGGKLPGVDEQPGAHTLLEAVFALHPRAAAAADIGTTNAIAFAGHDAKQHQRDGQCADHAASLRWQALRWPGATSRNTGCSTLHRSIACGQRGWKWQPVGGFSGEGISPLTVRNACRPAPRRGTWSSSACV